jgi:hypothetical protein
MGAREMRSCGMDDRESSWCNASDRGPAIAAPAIVMIREPLGDLSSAEELDSTEKRKIYLIGEVSVGLGQL